MKQADIDKYYLKDIIQRTNLIMDEYAQFPMIIECEKERLKYWIIEDRRYRRSHNRSDLGVRVQNSRISDVTAEEAMESYQISKWIESKEITEEMVRAVDTIELLERLDNINMMDEDYRLFCKVFKRMPDNERTLLLYRFSESLSLEDISEIYKIEPVSVKKRIQRARTKLRTQMEESMRTKKEMIK